MFEYFDLDKDEMIYSSRIFYYITPIIIFIRIFVFYLFEYVARIGSNKYSSTFRHLSQKQKDDWTSKATSTFHAILVTILCIPHTLTDIIYRESDKDIAYGVTKRRVDVILWTLAYLIYDSYMMIRVNRQQLTLEMIIHHVVCISAFLLCLYLNVGTVFIASFIINEISTPFLHFRWYFSRMNLRDSTMATINNLIFALTYLLFRGVWNTYVVYVLCTGFWNFREELHKNVIPFGIIACLPLFAISHLILNYYWLSLIILHIVHPKPSSSSSPTTPEDLASLENQTNDDDPNEEHDINDPNEKQVKLENITIYGTNSNNSSISSTTTLRDVNETTPLISPK